MKKCLPLKINAHTILRFTVVSILVPMFAVWFASYLERSPSVTVNNYISAPAPTMASKTASWHGIETLDH